MDQNFSSFQNYQPGEGEDQEIPFVKIRNASYFRAKARDVLKGRFINACLMLLLYFAISWGISMLLSLAVSIAFSIVGMSDRSIFGILFTDIASFIISILMLFVSAPLVIGYHRMNLDMIDDKPLLTETLFCFFKQNYFNTVKYIFLYNAIIYLCRVPALAVRIATWYLVNASIISPMVSRILQIVVSIGCLALMIPFVYRFAMGNFILAEYPEMSAVDVLRSSANMMRGKKWKLFCLHFSFIGWFFVYFFGGICTCFIGLLVGFFPLMSYIIASTAAFYDDAANREAAKQAEFPSLDPDDYTFDTETKNNEE